MAQLTLTFHTCRPHRHPLDDHLNIGHDGTEHETWGATGELGHVHAMADGVAHDPAGCDGCAAHYDMIGN